VREERTDVLEAEAIDQQLGQLNHARRQRLHLGRQRSVAGDLGHAPVVVAHHPDAGRRRRDHQLAVGEGAHEAPDQRDRLLGVAGVEVHLPAAGLFEWEVHCDAQPLEQ